MKDNDLATAERLLPAERARLAGKNGYTVDEFEKNMKDAIARGAADCRQSDDKDLLNL